MVIVPHEYQCQRSDCEIHNEGCCKETCPLHIAVAVFGFGTVRCLSNWPGAREIVPGQELIVPIAAALQNAFDLGYRAAGGSVGSVRRDAHTSAKQSGAASG